jgi:choline dehydrogenase-like flavoprotein
MLVVVASASVAMATSPAPANASHGTLGGHATQTPRPGPCLQNAAQCAGAGSIVASSALGAPLLVVGGAAIIAAALARRVRRRRRESGLLPDGRPLVIMRPPRSLPAFA